MMADGYGEKSVRKSGYEGIYSHWNLLLSLYTTVKIIPKKQVSEKYLRIWEFSKWALSPPSEETQVKEPEGESVRTISPRAIARRHRIQV